MVLFFSHSEFFLNVLLEAVYDKSIRTHLAMNKLGVDHLYLTCYHFPTPFQGTIQHHLDEQFCLACWLDPCYNCYIVLNVINVTLYQM